MINAKNNPAASTLANAAPKGNKGKGKPSAPVPLSVPSSACRTADQIRGAMIAVATDARFLIPSAGQVKSAADAGYTLNAKPDGTYTVRGASAARFVVALYADAAGSDARTLQIHYADGSTDPIRRLANMIVGKRARAPRLGK